MIECAVEGGRGMVEFGDSKYLGQSANTRRFSQWVLAQDGLNLHDQVGLSWEPGDDPDTSLRVAIDGPVSKPARLLSITDDTVVGVVATSDQEASRHWIFTINFDHEKVAATALSSTPVGVKAQVLALSCTFNIRQDINARRSAVDSWRRCCRSPE